MTGNALVIDGGLVLTGRQSKPNRRRRVRLRRWYEWDMSLRVRPVNLSVKSHFPVDARSIFVFFEPALSSLLARHPILCRGLTTLSFQGSSKAKKRVAV